MVKVTNLIKFYTLLLLNKAPRHGYELIKELESRLDRRISASQIYPFLESLNKEECIKAGIIREREKRIFTLTAKGRALVKQLLERFDCIIEGIIEKKLKKCANCGCYVYKGGFKRIVNNRMKMFCCRYCAFGNYNYKK